MQQFVLVQLIKFAKGKLFFQRSTFNLQQLSFA